MVKTVKKLGHKIDNYFYLIMCLNTISAYLIASPYPIELKNYIH